MAVINTPLLVAIEMGYGHLRAAQPLAELFGVPVHKADEPPLAEAREQKTWATARKWYELACRATEIPLVGAPLRAALEELTFIPHLHPYRDLSRPSQGVKTLDRLGARGLGAGMLTRLRATDAPLLTTFFAPAVLADAAGYERVFCVVTDTDINRIWAARTPEHTRIQYLTPSTRAGRRLVAYGVPRERIHLTGFPLPHSLLGGPTLPALKRNLAARIVRLDPKGEFRRVHGDLVHQILGDLPQLSARDSAPRIMFAVGGAGAQGELAFRFLPSLRPFIETDRIRLTLVAGVRREVADRFRESIEKCGLGKMSDKIEILFEPDHDTYFRRFNERLSDTDLLWSKPSEISFFAALGLPIVTSRPMGMHEQYNRRWLLEAGAGLDQGDPRYAGEWLQAWLDDGTLAGTAWSGFTRLPQRGLYEIEALVRGSST